jgi:hypothetical protein
MPEISNRLHDELTDFLRGFEQFNHPLCRPLADRARGLRAMLSASAPAEADDEPNDDEPRGRYEESASYRADMINAGRGHLLGG